MNRTISQTAAITLALLITGCAHQHSSSWKEWFAEYSCYKQVPGNQKAELTDQGRKKRAVKWATFEHDDSISLADIMRRAAQERKPPADPFWAMQDYRVLDDLLPFILESCPKVRLEVWRHLRQWHPADSDWRMTVDMALSGSPVGSFELYHEAWETNGHAYLSRD